MSKGMHPKPGEVHILLGFQRGLHASKEKHSNPDNISESHLNSLSIKIRKPASRLESSHYHLLE